MSKARTLRRAVQALLAACVMSAALHGCATPPKQSIRQTGSSEIAKVVCFYPQNPFRSFDEAGDPNPEGFTVTVMLYSEKARRGVPKDGIIRMKMFRADPITPEKSKRTLVREWVVGTAGRPLFASHLLGQGYKLDFIWAKEDNILGRDIDLVVSFESGDGRVVQSRTKSFRVPAAKSG